MEYCPCTCVLEHNTSEAWQQLWRGIFGSVSYLFLLANPFTPSWRFLSSFTS